MTPRLCAAFRASGPGHGWGRVMDEVAHRGGSSQSKGVHAGLIYAYECMVRMEAGGGVPPHCSALIPPPSDHDRFECGGQGRLNGAGQSIDPLGWWRGELHFTAMLLGTLCHPVTVMPVTSHAIRPNRYIYVAGPQAHFQDHTHHL